MYLYIDCSQPASKELGVKSASVDRHMPKVQNPIKRGRVCRKIADVKANFQANHLVSGVATGPSSVMAEDATAGENFGRMKVSSVAYDGSLYECGLSYSNGMSFTTKDRDHDESSGNCAAEHYGGWWYKNCMLSNPNAGYFNTGHSGIYWNSLLELKETVMRVSRD
ncbi:ryncolin-1-like [Watersipora subatra]|uniref:ryncolin-1-like n=1 Tax=Watersipora subatra TaxID=2589382 RepID=UPI00355B4718